MTTSTQRIQVRRDTAANWTTNNPILQPGELGLDTTSGQLKVGDGTKAWSSLGYAFNEVGFKNALINGGFTIWQRGTSFTASDYGADRWVNARNGTTCTMSRQEFTVGQTAVPGEPQYYCRMVTTSSAGAGNYSILRQNIENVRTFAGQTVTLSFYAKADASRPIAVEFCQFFGTGGSPSSEVNTVGVTKTTLSTSWQKIVVTATFPSISGKTIGTNNNDFCWIHIWLDAGSNFNSRTSTLGQQSGTFEFAQIQLEPGAVATPFEQRPIGTELALCQRYFQKNTQGISGTAVSTTAAHFTLYSPVIMRTTPIMALSAAAKVDWVNNNNYTQSSSNISESFSGEGVYGFLLANFTGLTTHSRLILRNDGGAVSFSSEL